VRSCLRWWPFVDHQYPTQPSRVCIHSLRNFYKYLSSLLLRHGTQAIQRPDPLQDFASVRGGGAKKTQIVYSCNLNFHSVVPYLDLVIKNGLAERVEGEHIQYRITPKGVKALRHMQALEKLIVEMGEEGVA